jgi:two-component system, NarL family, response regulator DegU
MEGETPTRTRTGPARLLIADDHELFQDGLQRMLSLEPDLEVVGKAANGREVIELCSRLHPDLVLMDVRMPEMDGLEATRRIKSELPTTSVLILTTYDDPDYLFEAIMAGAAGYVLKDASRHEIIDAVHRTLSGEHLLDGDLAVQLIQRLGSESRNPRESPPTPQERGFALTVEVLTPREVEVLQLLAWGKTNKQIAEQLVVSTATVKVHMHHLIGKLGVSDRTQVVVRAIEMGLVIPETESEHP